MADTAPVDGDPGGRDPRERDPGDHEPHERDPAGRDPGLTLASAHLRLGSPALARAELEAFAVAGGLDPAGRIDLVEARWRAGDLTGAGEVAKAILATGDEPVMALVVAAEAASTLGRPTEARRLASRALDLDRASIDRLFAGMARSSVWPSDPSEPLPPPATLFPTERHALEVPMDASIAEEDAESPVPVSPDPPAGPGLWDSDEDGSRATGSTHASATGASLTEPRPSATPDPDANHARLAAARAALAAGDAGSAALHLGLLVRLSPTLADDVIDLIGDHDDPSLLMVRGDALRVVGRESEARAAYDRATGGL